MAARRKLSAPPSVSETKICNPQPAGEMDLFHVKQSAAILGTMEETNIRSMRESWLSRKYMGLWSRGSRRIKRSMRALAIKEAMAIVSTIINRKRWDLVCLKIPRRIKSEVVFIFSMISAGYDTGNEKKRKGKGFYYPKITVQLHNFWVCSGYGIQGPDSKPYFLFIVSLLDLSSTSLQWNVNKC